jgi:hypothetical protein
VVSVLAIGPKVRGLKPGRGQRIFNGDKNLLHRESKPSVPCRKILRHVNLTNMKRDTSQVKFSILFALFFLLRY